MTHQRPNLNPGIQDKANQANLEADKKRKQELIEDAAKNISTAFDDKVERGLKHSKKAEMARAAVKETFKFKLGKLKEQLKAKWAELKAKPNLTTSQFNAETAEIEKQIKETGEVAKAYRTAITRLAKDQKIGPQELARMTESTSASAARVVEILLLDRKKYSDLIKAMYWAFKIPENSPQAGQMSTASGKANALSAIEKHIDDPDVSLQAWAILSYLGPDDRQKVLGSYIQNNNIQDAQGVYDFLKKGVEHGAVSPLEFEKVIDQNLTGDQNTEAKELYKQGQKALTQEYEMKYYAQKEAQRYIFKRVDGLSATGKMITGPNALRLIAKGVIGVSAGMNIVFSFFEAGKLRNPFAALKSIATNPILYADYAANEAVNALYSKKEKKPGYLTENNNETQKIYRSQLFDALNLNGSWDTFFKDQQFKGGKALGEYTYSLKRVYGSKKEAIPRSKLTISQFLNWMKDQKNEDYSQQVAQLQEIQTQTDNPDDQFRSLAESFYILGIQGSEAKRTYNQALLDAKSDRS